ncbi:MAG: hypothetical protein ACP5QG_08225 [candidate division WOR-3 bacterium]
MLKERGVGIADIDVLVSHHPSPDQQAFVRRVKGLTAETGYPVYPVFLEYAGMMFMKKF